MLEFKLFAVGYSCNKGMFFKSRGMNHLVGTICMLPILYPFGIIALFFSLRFLWCMCVSFIILTQYTQTHNTTESMKLMARRKSRAMSFVVKSHFWWFSSLFQWF